MYKTDYQTPAKARYYNKNRFQKGGKFIELQESNFLYSVLKKRKINRVLDIGAGTGRASGYLLKHNPKKIILLDLSKDMLNLARENLSTIKSKTKIEYKIGDIEKYSFKNHSFDIIVALHLFKHLTNPELFFLKISQNLSKRGICIFDISNKYSSSQLRKGSSRLFSSREIDSFASQHNLHIFEQKAINIFGETPYFLLPSFLGIILNKVDMALCKIFPFFSTKILFVIKKNPKP